MDKLFAGIALAACIGLLVRLALPPARRQRLDAGLRRAGRRLHQLVVQPYQSWRMRRSAHRMADDLIRRARDGKSGGEWTGNVYRPKSFQRPPKKDLERQRKDR